MRELSELGALRSQGKSPQLPVYVTDLRGPFADNLRDVGCFVIRLWRESESWDWTPVAGLEVIMAFHAPASRYALDVARAIKRARPRWLRVIDWTAPHGEQWSPIMPTWGRA